MRVFKTRTVAADACNGGHVRVNGSSVKSSAKLKLGDRVEALVGRRERVVVVTKLIDKRVSAALAAECYEDHSPPVERAQRVPPVAVREAGAGRPTKRDRRMIDRLRRGR